MKLLISTVFTFLLSVVYAQSVPVQQPVEEQYHISYWWWVLGVFWQLVQELDYIC
jgi:hypothetical protein